MAQIKCVCINTKPKTSAENVHSCPAGKKGLEGDIHLGHETRQVSLLPMEQVQDYFSKRGEPVRYGQFGENLVVEGLDWESLQIGGRLRAGTVLLEITRIGAGGPKSEAYKGDKICAPMEKLYIFCKVLEEGTLTENMEITKETE